MPDLLDSRHHVLGDHRVTFHAFPLILDVALNHLFEKVELLSELLEGFGAAARASAVVIPNVESKLFQVLDVESEL